MMELEFYQELLLTAVFSVLIAFLIGKIAVASSGDGELTEDAPVSADRSASVSTRAESERSESQESEASADLNPKIRVESLRHVEEEGSLLHGEDEWEGIEKSEVSELFGVATEYVRSSSGAVALAGLNADVQMELYGLNKIATEGPCYESQPLPLNFSARAKWQAWQRLGNMSPEVAMEHYIGLLSKSILGWMDINSGEDVKCDKGNDSPVAGTSDSGSLDLRLSLQRQLSSETQRKSKDIALVEIDHATRGSKILEQGFTSTFIINPLSPTRGAFLSIYW